MIAIDDAPPTPYAAERSGSLMSKKREKETRRVMVGVRLVQEDADRLDALHSRIPVASRHAIAREALRIGIAVLEKDPTRLVGVGAKRSGAVRSKR